jgi:hypothetical protein
VLVKYEAVKKYIKYIYLLQPPSFSFCKYFSGYFRIQVWVVPYSGLDIVPDSGLDLVPDPGLFIVPDPGLIGSG